MKKNKKELYFLRTIIIGIGLSCFFVLFANSSVYAAGSLPSGSISADKTAADAGESVRVTINGENTDGLISLDLYYEGSWHSQYVSGISNSAIWTVSENYPGTYRYCGRVKGYSISSIIGPWTDASIRSGNVGTTFEYANTSPQCVDIEVSGSYSPLLPSCQDQCSYSGQTSCYNSSYRRICGDYDSDSCLEWSSLESCSGSNSCGYGRCDDDERPNWYCSGGNCTYSCQYSSSCVSVSCSGSTSCGYGRCDDDERPNWYYSGGDCTYNCQYSSSCISSSRQCSKGSCCDRDNYRPSTWVCDFDIQTQYGCPWGTVEGADVGKRTRTRLKYCSGSSAECTGTLGNWLPWTSWEITDSCEVNEVCSVGSPYCYSSAIKPASNACPVQEEENDSLVISVLEKREGSSSKWEKEIKVDAGESIDFLLVVANKGKEELKDVILKTEFPQEVIYKDNFKINGDSLEGDIKSGFNIGSFSPGIIKTIVFQGEVFSGIGIGEKDIKVQVAAGDLSALDSVKISFEELQKQKAAIGLTLKSFLGKWYNWILVILGMIILFYFIKGILNWFKK